MRKLKSDGLILGALLISLILSQSAEALPMWARKYNADCTMCHTMYPQLNSTGHRFRRLGYRMPDEFNKGDAQLSWEEVSKFANYFSARGRGKADFSTAKGGPNTFSFSQKDVTLFYAGPATRNVSFFFEIPFEPDGALEVGQMLLNFGQSDGTFFTRFGKFHQFSRVGFGGLDRPIGLTNARMFEDLINGFRPRLDNVGIELGYSTGNLTGLLQVTNGIKATGGAASVTDTNNQKDIAVLLEYLFPDTNASASLLYVYGQAPVPTDNTAAAVAVAGASASKYHRGYLFADYTFDKIGLRPIVGASLGLDNQFITGLGGAAPVLAVAGNSVSWSGFLELDQKIKETLYALARFDYSDPTTQSEFSTTTAKNISAVGGLVWNFQNHMRVSTEYQARRNSFAPATHAVTVEGQLNF